MNPVVSPQQEHTHPRTARQGSQTLFHPLRANKYGDLSKTQTLTLTKQPIIAGLGSASNKMKSLFKNPNRKTA